MAENKESNGVKEAVLDLVADQFNLGENNNISMDANFRDDLGGDSLDEVEIVMELEGCFDIEINDDDAEGLHTINDVIAYLEGRGVDSVT